MGDLRVETDALLRDNNFGSDEFSDAVMKSVGWETWTIDTEDEASLASRRDLRGERTFTIDPNGTKELDDAFHVKKLGDGKDDAIRGLRRGGEVFEALRQVRLHQEECLPDVHQCVLSNVTRIR